MIALVLFGAGRPLRAELQYSLMAGGLAGWSDNPSMLPSSASPRSSALLGGRGSLQVVHVGKLMREQLGYGIVATEWLGGTSRSALAHTLNLSSLIEPSAAVQVTLHGGATLSRMSMLEATAPSDRQTFVARPAGDVRFLAVEAGETLSWQIGGSWHIGQLLGGRFYRPLDGAALTESKGATFGVDIDHLWQRDWAGLSGRLGVLSATGGAQTGTGTAAINQSESAQAELTWRHVWTPELFQVLGGGILVLRADSVRVLPAASARVAWRGNRGDVELHAARTAESNVFLGAIYERNFVGLTAGLPLDRFDALRASASGEVEHVTASVAGGASNAANILNFRCGLHWQPGELFTFGLEYWYRDQRAVASETPNVMLGSLKRQMAMFTVDVRYPPRGYYR